MPYPHASTESALLAGEKSCPLRPSACSAGEKTGHRPLPAPRNGIPPLFPTLRGFFPPCARGRLLPHARSGLHKGGRKAVPPKKCPRLSGRGGKAAPSPAGTKKTKKKPSPMPDVGKRGRPGPSARLFSARASPGRPRRAQGGLFPAAGTFERRCCAPIFPFFVTLLIFPVIFTCCFSLSFLRP